jgi:hypothetical protein
VNAFRHAFDRFERGMVMFDCFSKLIERIGYGVAESFDVRNPIGRGHVVPFFWLSSW